MYVSGPSRILTLTAFEPYPRPDGLRRTSEMHSLTVPYAVLRADLTEVPVNLASAEAEQQHNLHVLSVQVKFNCSVRVLCITLP